MKIEIKTSRPVYTQPSEGEYEESNPFRLTPYVKTDGEIWLRAEGNGCADDEPLPNVEDMTQAEAWGACCEYDIDAMREDAAEIEEAGDPESAEWLRGWCERMERVMRGTAIDAETRATVLDVMRTHDMTEVEDIGDDDEITEVWHDEHYQLYRIDGIVTLYLLDGAGEPSLFDDLAMARSQIAVG